MTVADTESRRWLHVVGIGDDGLGGLSAAAQALVAAAEVLVGGERHQAMVPEYRGERITWRDGLPRAFDAIAQHRGQRVVVLASGDPMCYGAGVNLQRVFELSEMVILPAPGAFSLAAARMGWSLPDCECVTIHGRPLDGLLSVVAPGMRVLALSRDGTTPAAAAALLTERGYGPSRITVLEHLGGPKERHLDGIADAWQHGRTADLNTLAIVCEASSDTRVRTRAPGLPDDAFNHDGQMTKREVRAITIAALAPLPGQTLWDVGAGAGSVAIEWLRCLSPRRRHDGRGAAAIAIERDAERAVMIARNASALGVPDLTVHQGEAPECLRALHPRPDSVFVGGGVTVPGLLETCWSALSSRGRMIVNTVTVEGEAALATFQSERGGALTRIAIQRADPVGDLTAFKPLMPVTQYAGVKP